ncbi:MAG: hypothetical protein ABIH77_04705 [Pseudomonadota bacterium]|nr:hypothetical protein [Gammaproteobacteria bacterium]MBU1558728.1 hypothetical protein [Gammaproteobacteria bacterium]MBU1927277.1 hypothetical protein [Gammaproteobacteria bacterium]MBU2546344.1 hypothetical protein [Gammaproteobacteria bacterium]
MRITMTISNKTIGDLLQYSPSKNSIEAINWALNDWIRLKKIQEIKKLQGQIDITNNLEKLRHSEIEE